MRYGIVVIVYLRVRLCFVAFHLPCFARFACFCVQGRFRPNKFKVNNGQPPIRRIGNGFTIIPTSTTRIIFTRRNTIRAARTCIIATLPRCVSLRITRIGSIFIPRNGDTTGVIISDWTYSRDNEQNRKTETRHEISKKIINHVVCFAPFFRQ